MSFKIERGLFKFDFTDHHAVLGVPVDASAKDIRKRYLQIARRLHPDSCAAENAADKQKASQLLSKLVNPAYEKIARDSNRAEYMLLLTQMGKRLVQESATVELNSELAKQLAQTPNVDGIYKTLIHKIAEKQYDSLDQVPQSIAQISELNLVYLMRKGGKAFQSPPPASVSPSSTTGRAARTQPSPPPPPPPQSESVAAQYFRRAEELVRKNNLAQARVELQDALKLEPNNGQYHSLMGTIYLRQNQNTMAKVHINKALQLNPKDELALKAKRYIDQTTSKAGSQPTPPPKSHQGKPDPAKPSDRSDGGLFGGLFGGKKK